jgi:hypothetical protein
MVGGACLLAFKLCTLNSTPSIGWESGMVLWIGRCRISTSPCCTGLGLGRDVLGPKGALTGAVGVLVTAAWAYDGACGPLLSVFSFRAVDGVGRGAVRPPSTFLVRERTKSLNSLISFSCADTLATTSALSSALSSFISALISSPRSETTLLNSSSIMPSWSTILSATELITLALLMASASENHSLSVAAYPSGPGEGDPQGDAPSAGPPKSPALHSLKAILEPGAIDGETAA